MASNTNPFLTAHYEKTVLTEQTAKRIQRIYKQSAQDIEKKLRNLKMLNPSDSLKKIYFENLLKDINKSSDSFNRLIQSTVMGAGEQAGSIAVDAGNKMMKLAGLEIKGAYSYIPRQQVLNIASGKLYGDSWTLSQSIWKNGLRTKSDIQNVVAKGLTENKPIKDIADDLMKYVDPTARKPWDWSKVYPGTATKVDYNAQRLARTMIQHSFQSSLVQSQRYNPFCRGVTWHSVGLHGRTCELCMERDGNVFPLKDLPLDHPNGLCYFEPALDAMTDIADRLGDWVNGGSDPALDTYVAKAFNLSPKSTTGKRVVNTVKESAAKKAVKMTKAEKQKFIDENLQNTKKAILRHRASSKKLPQQFWDAVEKQLLAADDDYLRFFAQGDKRIKYFIRSGKGAYFDGADTIDMSFKVDIIGEGGKLPLQVFFHEYGHLIDREMGKFTGKAMGERFSKRCFTSSETFGKSLYSSLEKEYNKLLNEDGSLKKSVADALRKDDVSAGVQDIISGLSLNKNRICWGHSTSYWMDMGKDNVWKQVNSEAAANMSDAWCNPKVAKYFKKYFPESFELFKKEVMKYVK